MDKMCLVSYTRDLYNIRIKQLKGRIGCHGISLGGRGWRGGETGAKGRGWGGGGRGNRNLGGYKEADWD